MLKALNLNTYRRMLNALRARVDGRAEQLREEAFHGVGGDETAGFPNAPIDQVDRASHEAEVGVSIGLAENEAALRKEIDDALERIDGGAFGMCERCQAKIDVRRLDAVPYTRFCVRCADCMEQRA